MVDSPKPAEGPLEYGTSRRQPQPPSSLKASGKRAWKRIWELGQDRLCELDETGSKLVCEQADQVADLRRMAEHATGPDTEIRYRNAILAAERSLRSMLIEIGFAEHDLPGFGLAISEQAKDPARPRRRGRRRTTQT